MDIIVIFQLIASFFSDRHHRNENCFYNGFQMEWKIGSYSIDFISWQVATVLRTQEKSVNVHKFVELEKSSKNLNF